MPRIQLDAPHAGQQEIWRRALRFNVINCGRRFGKTKFGMDRLITGRMGALAGYPTAWFAPSYKYLADPWREVLEKLKPVVVAKDKTERRIELRGGGVIDFWTLDDPDAGRSRKYGRIVVDEAAKCRYLQQAWEQSIRPTLSDYAGEADFLSTPKGRNYYATLFDYGTAGHHLHRRGWRAFRMPTSSNPFIRKSEIADARRDLPDLVFRQEFLAEFVDFGGSAIRSDWIQYGDPFKRWNRSQLVIAAGVDLAISQKTTADWTAVVVVAMDPDRNVWVIHSERRRLTFNAILEMITRIGQDFGVDMIGVEETQFQAAVVQELMRTTNLPVRGLKADRDKVTRFQRLSVRFERSKVYLSDTLPAEFEGELLSFPEGDHDDQVDALVYAFYTAMATDLAENAQGTGDRLTSAGPASIDDSIGWGTVSSR